MLKNLYLKWKVKTTTEKIACVLDILTMVGGGLIGADAGKKASQGHTVLGQICIRATTAGLGMAAGDIACKALREAYAETIGKLVDKAKEKMKEEA